MTDKPRLIEFAFPLEQASIDSVHEKNARHGHISTLHVWPARRPLAASRAALIATLLADPGFEHDSETTLDADSQKAIRDRRTQLAIRIGGRIKEVLIRKKMPNGVTAERRKPETVGGVLRWLGTEPSSGRTKIEQHRRRVREREQELGWFRQQLKDQYGRPPRVLDPFAGGGAIPLEAIRLGCETTAADVNPVASFVLKCTLFHPQQLAGKTTPLPDFVLEDEEFMNTFYDVHPQLVGRTRKTRAQEDRPGLFDAENSSRSPRASLSWHVRAWGRWVLNRARRDLVPLYPTYADFEPIDPMRSRPFERQPATIVPLGRDGRPDESLLNRELGPEYLSDPANPRWVAKPTVAYLWARTVTCKNCRATIPLLKTRWLCRTDNKRVVLEVRHDDALGLLFTVIDNVSVQGGNAAQRREYDRRVAAGTMTGVGAKCLNCPSTMTMPDIRAEAVAGRCGMVSTAVVVAGRQGKEYRTTTEAERSAAAVTFQNVENALQGIPEHSLFEAFEPASTRSISAQLYGVRRWADLFTSRQLFSLATIASCISAVPGELERAGYPDALRIAVHDELVLGFDRLLSFMNVNARWKADADSLTDSFSRYSISLLWDFAEANPLGNAVGSYERCNERIAAALDNIAIPPGAPAPQVLRASAADIAGRNFDVIITDPPYYQAVSYADLSDFFYVWLRGLMGGRDSFQSKLTPKDDEFVQHIRADKDRAGEKAKYERQMEAAFTAMRESLTDDGRLVCVFAHKDPDAWETLVSALIASGFVVTGSWPIQTEMPSRQRGSRVAALASSVWLVCRKRSETARSGWDTVVLESMRTSIADRLRQYWDAGIKGPDFVWAATGPALEAYSRYPIVKKANSPGMNLPVGEFLSHVRRIVVDFVIGRVLRGDSDEGGVRDRLDGPTAYYLLHRNDFNLGEAPSGACILYATACGLNDHQLDATWDLISHVGRAAINGDEPEDDVPGAEIDGSEPDGDDPSASKIRLKRWTERKQKSMGVEAPAGQAVPLIDRIHRLMHIWCGGDVAKVDQYLDEHGLRRQELFRRVLQSLIELSEGEERSLLESISNHIQARGAAPDVAQIASSALSELKDALQATKE